MELSSDDELTADVLAILDGELEPSATGTLQDVTLDLCTAPFEPWILPALDLDGATTEQVGVHATPSSPAAEAITTAPSGGEEVNSVAAAVQRGSKKGRKCDPNKARNARVHEIRSLKIKEGELARQLSTLQGLDTQRHSATPSSAAANQMSRSGGLHIWEEICQRQLVRRIRSENENVRLRRAVDEQVTIVRSLQRLLEKPSRVLVRSQQLDELCLLHVVIATFVVIIGCGRAPAADHEARIFAPT